MDIYKKGQGKIVRMATHAMLLLMAAYGCYELFDELYLRLSRENWFWRPLIEKIILGKTMTIRPILIISFILFCGAAYLILWYLNRPTAADFLIETEDELRRVSWPPRKEYITSSLVIIVVMVIFSIFLFGADKGLSELLRKLGIGF